MNLASHSLAILALLVAAAGCGTDKRSTPSADAGVPPGAPASDAGFPPGADTDQKLLSDGKESSSDAGEGSSDAGEVNAPRIRVIPPSCTFQRTTDGIPQMAAFAITNEGNDKLVIYKVSFAQPSTEFTLLAPPIPNAELEAQDAAPENKLVFQVRYQPIDEEHGDSAVIEIHSNDPERGIVEVELKSK
jgi:hypothetical protein